MNSTQHRNTARTPQSDYLKSAISQIYRDDDGFIILGLTGRTGSGCSTVAKLLQTEKNNIRHSLFSGDTPSTNEERKQRIVLNHYNATWEPFLQIQVRSIITTFLLERSNKDAKVAFAEIFKNNEDEKAFCKQLSKMRKLYNDATKNHGTKEYTSFFTKTLPEECEKLRSTIGESGFVKLYQTIGKNIRLSGDAYSNELIDGQFFSIAHKIKEVIDFIHLQRKSLNQKTYIVVDALRNPLEAIFFQEKYPSFYLMAISTSEQDRLSRLRKQNYSEADISSINETEYKPKSLHDTAHYSVQDIKSCLERADLYMDNPNVPTRVSEFQHLSNQIIRFTSLLRRPGIITPTPIERCMQIAYTAKLNSGCISRQVGAAVTDKNYSIKSIGWNDAPHGQVPCNLRKRDDLLAGNDSKAYSEFEKTNEDYLADFSNRSKKYFSIVEQGRSASFCFKSEYNNYKKENNQVHTRSLHAEENAFLQMAKYGSSGIEGGFLFTTASPCELCSKKAYQLGITNIFYIDPYPGIAMTHTLMGGDRNPSLNLFSGAIGRAFHKLYSPIVPYKDELNALTVD